MIEMSGSVFVRDARDGDGAAIGRVQVQSWQATYRGVFGDDHLDALDLEARGREWTEWLATGDERPHARMLVVEVDAIVQGFSSIGPNQDGLGSDVGEVWSIYLHPDVIGRGVGRALFAAVVDVLRARGHVEAVLWVAEANVRARRFYERAGWNADGATKTDTSFGPPVVEVRYRTRLTP